MASDNRLLSLNPLYVAAYLYLWIGLVLVVYHGLEWLDLVPRVGWIAWSHIHIVTIGAFAQLLFGFVPIFTAQKLDRPMPASWYPWLTVIGLNTGVFLAWYGRSFGMTLVFDIGVYLIWLLALGLLMYLLKMVMQSDRAWDPSIGLYLVSSFVFLWGITYAYGLFAHVWQVPGGWSGLREAHIHANGWGFFGLAAIGTLHDLFPRMVDVDLHSERLKKYSVWFLVIGIFPLITGPWLGLRQTVTAGGLVLFVVGFVLYAYNLIQTYRAGTSSGLALWILVAQFWILGPALGSPFVFFGIEWVAPRYIEMGVLHFFFIGWALSIVFTGLLLYANNFIGINREEATPDVTEISDAVAAPNMPGVVSAWMVWVWNIAMLVLGIGFFYQEQPWASHFFGAGAAVLAIFWAYYLVQTIRLRRAVLASSTTG
jgi:cytochrome c oxidase cbb3-type subunit 1